jgi:rhamnogalacturonyl hydrolase YesR
MKKQILPVLLFSGLSLGVGAQQKQTTSNDVTTPLHLLQPDYPTPYGAPSSTQIKNVLDRVFNYLDQHTPALIVNKKTGEPIQGFPFPDSNIILKPGQFRLTSYEWGVTYAAMLNASIATGDDTYANYTKERLQFLAKVTPGFRQNLVAFPTTANPLKQVLTPKALDDGGAICAAMIKALPLCKEADLRPLINHYMEFISKEEFRLKDGTLARNRPLKNTLWLDDMFMGVPALAQMGKLTGNKAYTDDAVKQFLQFSKRMFNPQLNIYMHGWVESMEEHPEFHWARANGWALLATEELLDVLPVNHPQRATILTILKKHIKGLASYQSGTGFWHQLLDRTDSYLETSATAIYSYGISHAINQGWIDAKTYGPAAILAWNAVATKVNAQGQVEGTCVGTGMAFDPAFYYHRPINTFAAHGYGPTILAGAELIQMLKKNTFGINDSASQLLEK